MKKSLDAIDEKIVELLTGKCTYSDKGDSGTGVFVITGCNSQNGKT